MVEEHMVITAANEVKAVYLAERNPEYDHAAFIRRWRRHGDLAMSLGMWKHTSGYRHHDAITPPSPGYFGEADQHYDGLGAVYFRSIGDFELFHSHADYPRLRNDEYTTFSGLVETKSALLQEEVIVARPGTAAKLLFFLFAAEDVGQHAFAQRWKLHIGQLMRQPELMQLVTSYAHSSPVAVGPSSDDHLLDAVDAPEPPLVLSGTLTELAGLAELGFASVDDLARYLGEARRQSIVDDLAGFCALERTITVVTNTVVMVPRAQGPEA
jgi:hypothetical protein